MQITRQKAWRLAHPDRYRAHLLVERAKRRGDLLPGPCEICGKRPTEAHHDSYDQPLSVRWLCRKCHVRLHRKEGR